jgi:hypothetical protein
MFGVKVICPHCGAEGIVMLPPIGATIFGPCPECLGPVMIFQGNALKLDRQIMKTGTIEAKRQHFLEVATEFLKDKFAEMITEENGFGDQTVGQFPETPTDPITGDEVQRFLQTDLNALDPGQGERFRQIFGDN